MLFLVMGGKFCVGCSVIGDGWYWGVIFCFGVW